MKQVIYMLLTFTILSCNHQPKEDDLLGIWDVVSSTDLGTQEVELSENEFFEIKSDSLYLISDEGVVQTYDWRIKGDSIILDEFGTVFIKKLAKDSLIVEYEFLGKTKLILHRRQ